MIEKMVKISRLYAEFNQYAPNQNKYFFDRKQQKYLHNVDTFYYSIDINLSESKSEKFFARLKSDKEKTKLKQSAVSSIDSRYVVNGFTFGIYLYDLEMVDEYLILIAENVPNEATPNIVVQLRSFYLWTHGVNKAVEQSLAEVKELLSKFDIGVNAVKVNRVDYCWHTNYVQDVDSFFDLKNIAKMRVSRMREFDCHGVFLEGDLIEHDYFRLGRLQSNNLIFRAYLKSKEVVEMGYKSWFFYIWFFHGLINRYDLYCYEECFKRRSWDYLNRARLEFYCEYGKDEKVKKVLRCLLDDEKTSNKVIHERADDLTPKVTMIINFEFQTMRKFMNSIEFKNFRCREGELADVQTVLDFRPLIIDYLTSYTLRFVNRQGPPDRKDRRDLAPFWDRLRHTRIVDCIVPNENISLVRNYASELNAEYVKKSAMKAVSTYNVYNRHTDSDLHDDILTLVSGLNDNDIREIKRYKEKKIYQLGLQGSEADIQDNKIKFIDIESGEIL